MWIKPSLMYMYHKTPEQQWPICMPKATILVEVALWLCRGRSPADALKLEVQLECSALMAV